MNDGKVKTIYKIERSMHNEADLERILSKHPEIKFLSVMSVDLYGNVTDERIPIKIFLKDLNEYLNGKAIQTDGSSVNLPIISELNDARVDLILDLDCNWYVDYNYELFDYGTDESIGTLIIPAFIKHNDELVDSRSILKKSNKLLENKLKEILTEHAEYLYGINSNEVKNINFTTATELEFWVKTPNSIHEIEDLSASQTMHEQYWNKIEGSVRAALEQCLLEMEEYGLEPEMGHKEVGGVRPSLGKNGKYNDIMEQIEIDWKYTNSIDLADNQILVKNLIKKIFNHYGLEVTFLAKPVERVAGSGMHLHLGVNMGLENGKIVNIFQSKENTYLGNIGYGALMGLLKNYEIINPFISNTEDAFRRLKPGYEAPVAVVTSLGNSAFQATRNRSVLIGLVFENDNPLATRFELRSPNPNSNLYLTIAASYMAMLDGIKFVTSGKYSELDLLKEVSKQYGEDGLYLEKNRMYRSEENIFEYYTDEERIKLFGKVPRNVYENLKQLNEESEKLNVLKQGDIFTNEIIESYKVSVINNWKTVYLHRTIKQYIKNLRNIQKIESENEYDEEKWNEILAIKEEIYKDTNQKKSIFSQIRNLLENNNMENASNLIIDLEEKMNDIKQKYKEYKNNIL